MLKGCVDMEPVARDVGEVSEQIGEMLDGCW